MAITSVKHVSWKYMMTNEGHPEIHGFGGPYSVVLQLIVPTRHDHVCLRPSWLRKASDAQKTSWIARVMTG